jgi:hypothetical protein
MVRVFFPFFPGSRITTKLLLAEDGDHGPEGLFNLCGQLLAGLFLAG